jgi:hypothetical protein
MPLTAVAFKASGAPVAETNRLAQLLVHDPMALATSAATLHSVEGLEAQAAAPEQFAAFCGRFKALRRLRLQLPTEHGKQALQVLPAGLQYLSANAAIDSFQVRCAFDPRVSPILAGFSHDRPPNSKLTPGAQRLPSWL